MEKPIIELAIENMDEFNELIKKAQQQSAELEKTLSSIKTFQQKISYPNLERKQC